MGKKKGGGRAPKQSQQEGPPQDAEGGRGRPPVQEQGPPQSAGGSRGPPPAQQQGPPQSAWGSRGPPPAQQQGPPQSAGGSRGPPPAPQQGPPQSAWGSRGPPPAQQQGPPQSAWGSRGPPPAQQQGPPQSAWGSRGPPPVQQQGPPQSAGGSRGPPPAQQQRPQSAWGNRGPPPVQQQGPSPHQQRPLQSAGDSGAPAPSQQQPSQKHDTLKKDTRPDVQRSTSSSSSSPPGSSEGTLEFAPRINAEVKSGIHTYVTGNFFRLIIKNPNTEVYHYDVTMEPDKPQFMQRLVWKTFAAAKFPKRLAAFHGRIALSNGPLINGKTCTATISVVNPENHKEKEFNVTITEVKRVSLACFENYRESLSQDKSKILMAQYEISALDYIMSNQARDNFVATRKHFFPLSSVNQKFTELSGRLDMKLGYFQSAFLGYVPYLNFDIAYKPFYHSSHLLNILESFRNKRTNELNVEEFNRYIRMAKIEYELPNNPSSRRIFRANKLVENANRQTFKKDDGTQMTVAQYFAKEKKCKLKYPDLELLWVGPTQKEIYVPIEFCTVLPDQIYKGVMDPQETRKMVQFQGKINAKERYRQVNEMLRTINFNSHPLMREFGISVDPRMEKIPARILDPPTLRTKENIRVNEGVWRIRNFLEPVPLKNWCVINTDRYIRKENIITLQDAIKSKGKYFNMQIGDPKRNPMDVDPNFAALKKAFSQLRDMDIVFVIISDAKGVYSRVKTICETQEGVLTQCLRSRTVSQDPRMLSTTVENILLKVNPKLGGRNHCLSDSSLPKCLNGLTMVVGADVTHSSPGMKIPSVAAVAASCDPVFFQYSITIRVQPKGEIIVDLQEIMSIHLKRFYEHRKRYPEKIIFFRDGVSEGEMPKVMKSELMAVKRACGSLCQPKITFVVVQKRHHARFFPTRPEDEGKNSNVRAGTCVDSFVVHPRDLDFYLVSHASALGTARPTRYRLLYDDNKLTDDEIEHLAFYLCHLLSRCNRALSYPGPTYYAHLAAFRARAYLEGLNINSDQDIPLIQKKMTDNISKISPMFFV